MVTVNPAGPYDSQGIDEIHLGKAPLVRVLAQIRHPQLFILAGEKAQVAALRVAEHLSSQYPIFAPERETAFFLTPEGVREKSDASSMIWHLKSDDESWQVSFSSEFISLDTSTYLGRQDFHDKLVDVLQAYASEIRPKYSSRIGVRYTNRIDSPEHLAALPRLARPELLGPLGAQLPDDVNLGQFYSQAQFTDPNGGLILQWGLIPPDRVFDPTIGGVPRPSWILDIDSFDNNRVSFDPVVLGSRVRDLATRAYGSFRWAVNEEFLNTFKGA